MRVLVTGGTGVVGQATVTALVGRGHEVRLLSRHAEEDVKSWPHRVTAHAGSIASTDEVRGAADDCECVVHLAAIVAESPPDSTFEKINVDGTRNVVAEAARAGVPRLVYVSSLGADRGESPYHQSKRRGEEIARTFGGAWTIVRPGNVYGPGDEQISLLLKMVRSLPVVPVVGGDRRFQPIWSEDVALALATVAERVDLAGRVLEVAGSEVITVDETIDRLCALTDRDPMRLPLPIGVASAGMKVAEMVGVDLPMDSGQITMLVEENVIESGRENALDSVLDIQPTSIDEGLRCLADALPEQLPEEGVGRLTRKRFWADIAGCRLGPDAVFERFQQRFAQLTPAIMQVGVEPGTPTTPREGETLTMSLPLRGNVQVRIEELTSRRMTLLTLQGHPLAGAVRFLVEPRGERIRFEIQLYDRPSNLADWLVMTPVGGRLQNATWRETLERVIEESGGRAPDGVQQETQKLDEEQSALVNEWLDELVTQRKREERESRGSDREVRSEQAIEEAAAAKPSRRTGRDESESSSTLP